MEITPRASAAGASVCAEGMELGQDCPAEADEDEDLLKAVWLETLETARARYWASNPKERETRRTKAKSDARNPAHLGISDILGTVIGAASATLNDRPEDDGYPSAVISASVQPLVCSQDDRKSEPTDLLVPKCISSDIVCHGSPSLDTPSTEAQRCPTITQALAGPSDGGGVQGDRQVDKLLLSERPH